MKPTAIVCLALGLFGSLLASVATTSAAPGVLVHNWEYITFAGSPNDKQLATFLVGWPGRVEHPEEVSRGLRLDIMDIVQGLRFFKSNVITARLHRANGETVEPTAEWKELLNAPVSFSTFSPPDAQPPAQVLTYFPWGTNTLEESWIEVSLGAERYWLEIPYGFDRNPADPLPPSGPGGPPQLASAMKPLTGHDHIVRWQNVHYPLGSTQNGGELSLIQSNPCDAHSEVDLYEFPKIENLYSPRTSVRLLDAAGVVINGQCVNLHLDDNYLRRTDTFSIVDRGGHDLRCWGQIQISVDYKLYRAVIPSSLYRYVHGHVPLGERLTVK